MSEKISSTSTRSDTAYTLRVRATTRPFHHGAEIIGTEWQPLPTFIVPDGFGVKMSAEDGLTFTYGYYAAIALGAQFMAEHPWNAEVKLVRHRRTIKTELVHDGEFILEEGLMKHLREAVERVSSPQTGATDE